jgi:hypothetical protein
MACNLSLVRPVDHEARSADKNLGAHFWWGGEAPERLDVKPKYMFVSDVLRDVRPRSVPSRGRVIDHGSDYAGQTRGDIFQRQRLRRTSRRVDRCGRLFLLTNPLLCEPF